MDDRREGGGIESAHPIAGKRGIAPRWVEGTVGVGRFVEGICEEVVERGRVIPRRLRHAWHRA